MFHMKHKKGNIMRTYENRYENKEGYKHISEDTPISKSMIKQSVLHCYKTLNMLDDTLSISKVGKFSELVELANLSSIIGNILGAGLAEYSEGIYKRNKPNSYPDLIPNCSEYKGIEIKTAFNRNCPKGHLPKEDYYLIYRYLLTDENGQCNIEDIDKWNTVTIWEIRFGYLKENDFCVSNTKKDSGKTAAINISSLNNMSLLYFDPYLCPYSNSKLKNTTIF